MKNTYKKDLTLILIFIFITSSFIPIISVNSQKTNNLSSINSEEFDNKIKESMEKTHMPSLVTCIVRNDSLLWSKAYGYSKLGLLRKKEATLDTVYPIASITKSITATAIMQIIENDSYDIDLDDNVSVYLPFDLKNPRYPDINITYRMLLAHQSSLNDTTLRFILFYTILKIPFNLKTYKHYLVEDGLFYKPNVWKEYKPGEYACYTSQGTDLLGLLIEQITGQSYIEYCKEHIFEPLKMYNTSFHFSDFSRKQLANLYEWRLGFYLKVPYIQPRNSRNYASGLLKTTMSDFSHYLIMHTNGGTYGGVRILNESTVEEMHSAQYPNSYDGSYRHGLGWYFKNTTDNETYGGHGGNWQGGRAEMRMRYSDKVGVAMFWNQNSYLRFYLNRRTPEERQAEKDIMDALFEKADEL